MTRIDEIREFWANTAPSLDCCTTVFGKMASEHIAVLLAQVDALKKYVHRWDETVVEDILKAIVNAYKDVESAPDEALSPKGAWVVGASYVAEFTCRELWRKGIITQEEAAPVFKATGGDVEDPQHWVK